MTELRPLPEADLSGVEAVFTDVDGTLTTGGRLRASTLGALERLDRAGVAVVLVTGRPAGFAEAWARTLPVAGVIAENGGLSVRLDAQGALRKAYARPAVARARDRRRLIRVVQAALRGVPGARMSTDSLYAEVDLAIDVNEGVRLGPEATARLEAFFAARGVNAVRSSVHVNAWIGRFDKAWMVRRFIRSVWSERLRPDDRRYLYLGDSLNDAPLFAAFRLSVGVANVRSVLGLLEHRPRFVTRAPEGRGFEEVARAVLRARRTRA
ncbi:MAG TPA: HAD-IIB family hydrolase [Myxococcaceae bacterium]|nr:HAD-IIB family hydrolase [Myxococcaceae bacterium]